MAPANVQNGASVVRGVWCHMTADTHKELLAMAARNGMQASWIQHQGTWQEHFDVTLSRRNLAVEAGALEVGALQGVRNMIARWEVQRAHAD